MASNYILTSLDPTVQQQLFQAGRRCEFHIGDVICRVGEQINDVLFPFSGIIAPIIELTGENQIASAVIGNEGAIGGEAAFAAREFLYRATVQSPGVGLLVPVMPFVDACKQSVPLINLISAGQRFVLSQSQQTAACNARHPLEQRLASWLLRIGDAANSSAIFMTQDHIAALIGATRGSISGAASRLASEGSIEYRRGKLVIVDRERLCEQACECHNRIAKIRSALLNLESP